MSQERPWEQAGVSHRQFDHWIKKGWIPGVSPGIGTGRYYVLDWEQLKHLRSMGVLVELGMRPEAANKVVLAGRADAVISALRG